MNDMDGQPTNVWVRPRVDEPDVQTIRVTFYADVSLVDGEIEKNTPEGVRQMLNHRLLEGVKDVQQLVKDCPRWPGDVPALPLPTLPASETPEAPA